MIPFPAQRRDDESEAGASVSVGAAFASLESSASNEPQPASPPERAPAASVPYQPALPAAVALTQPSGSPNSPPDSSRDYSSTGPLTVSAPTEREPAVARRGVLRTACTTTRFACREELIMNVLTEGVLG